MKKQLFQLESVVKYGVGGPKAAAISLIYRYLLHREELCFYSRIFINQIGDDLEEFVRKYPSGMSINIRYPVFEDYKEKSTNERNLIKLDVIHTALLRLAEKDKRFEVNKLENIKNEILEKNFHFEMGFRKWVNKKKDSLSCILTIAPAEDFFDFHLIVSENDKPVCKVHIYRGKPTDWYIQDLFSKGKWKGTNEFILSGANKEVEIHLNIESCQVTLHNLTSYEKPPYFEMMKASISKEEREEAYADWLHSLPPAHATIIRESQN